MEIALAVFLCVFALIGILLILVAGRPAKEVTRTLARLESLSLAGDSTAGSGEVNLRRQQPLSTVPWLHRALLRTELALRLHVLIGQSGLKWKAGGLMLLSLGCWAMGAILVYLRTHTAGAAILLGGVAAAGPFLYVLAKRQQRFAKFEQVLPEALDLIVGGLRAGHSLASTFAMVAKEMPNPVAGEFRQCYEEQNFGLEVREALLNMTRRVPIHDLRIAVTAILIQKETGGNLAEVLDKTAYIIRERFRLRKQIRVYTAQGRMTGWILSLLPVILGILMYLVTPNHIRVLWTKPAGLKLLYGGAFLMLIGGLIIRKIVRVRV